MALDGNMKERLNRELIEYVSAYKDVKRLEEEVSELAATLAEKKAELSRAFDREIEAVESVNHLVRQVNVEDSKDVQKLIAKYTAEIAVVGGGV